MAPSHDTDTIGIYDIEILYHIITTNVDILVFQSSVIDIIVSSLAIPGATPVFGGDHDVFLGDQFPDDMGVIRVEISVYATMRENDQRIFLVGIHTFRDEDISPELQFVSGAHPGRIRLFPTGGTAKVDFIDMGDVAHFLVP